MGEKIQETKNGINKTAILFAPILGLSFLMSGCVRKDTWHGVYYPNGNAAKSIYSPVFDNYESCRRWGDSLMRNLDDEYECGKNCKALETPGLNPKDWGEVCEESL